MNPFTPTFGTSPPLLVGRDRDLEDFREGLRGGPGSPERATLAADARRRLEHIEQSHDSHIETATEDHPEVASAQVDRNGRQHDLTESGSYQNRSRLRCSPAR